MLAIAGIPYEKWFKFIWPLFLILALVAGLFIGVATVINY
jgi:uncharacterized ion transporter superfamily protein YfcC